MLTESFIHIEDFPVLVSRNIIACVEQQAITQSVKRLTVLKNTLLCRITSLHDWRDFHNDRGRSRAGFEEYD